jgi:L1 cell adhesion molecule like protein
MLKILQIFSLIFCVLGKATKIDGPVVGIDLGTTYSWWGFWEIYCKINNFLNCSVAIYENDRVDVIPNDQGQRITPSCVAFVYGTAERFVGDAAKNQLTINPKNTVFDAKRMIGRSFDDKHVQTDMKSWSFKVRNFHNFQLI